ncbi:MAG TPA: VWA domain-containing protein [Bryobacteraceae bacterium]|jgi:Ca-activated chloride channel family protein|nr:VWA domain-containing protein [Bryobacteraceae bacterium]
MKLTFLALLGAAAALAQQPKPAFQAETNLVLVPVVVRDAKGEAVGNLTKGDFRLFDNGKEQSIRSFEAEETASFSADAVGAMPRHFVALMFDDAHFSPGSFDDVVYPRNATLKYLDSLDPGDRVAFFTSSGQYDVDFTADRSKIKDALLKLAPCSRAGCPSFLGMTREEVALTVIRECDRIVTRMSILPGQRTLVFASSGLPIQNGRWSAASDVMHLVDHAIRSRVLINSLDIHGLSTDMSPTMRAWDFQLRITDGTGGRFVRDTNDMDAAMRQLAGNPRYMYILGFSPDTGRAKTGFHKLDVRVRTATKYDVQARSGYYDGTPKGEQPGGPATTAKTEPPHISEAETKELAKALAIAPPSPATAPTALPVNDEVVTTTLPATFRVQTNLVEVPVIVRDSSGHAIGNLKQENFHITDKGKRQEITKFTVETAGESSAAGSLPKAAPRAAPAGAAATPPATPTRFVALVFDDLHLRIDDVQQVRAAVIKYLNTSLGPGDRVALVTTSGQHGVDFTADPLAIAGPLNQITSSPIAETSLSGCGAYVSYFQSVQVDREVGLHPMASDVSKSLALRLAVEEYGNFDNAVMAIRDANTSGLQESRNTLAALRAVVRRMSAMPGQRTVLLASPGFFIPFDLQRASDDLMSQTIHAKVLISVVDARGVWTNGVYSACQGGASDTVMRDKTAFRDLEGHANTDELIAIAEDTGGTANFNNDFFGGVQKAAAAPDYLYILGFVPDNLKLDGSFHALKVSVTSGEKFALQARRGYWAPKHAEDEAAVSKQQIEDALFSRDETHGLAAEMHTRLTRSGDRSKLSVLTSLDLKAIPLRKADDRNRNDLTIVAALFDTNGNFLEGTEKLVQLRLLDRTVAGLQQKPPAVIATDFDVKPGAYLVRLVVRDAEEHQVTAENAAVNVQ